MSQPAAAQNDSVEEPNTDGVFESQDEPELQYRIPDEPPEINRQRLALAGIHVVESRRLTLLTDRDPESVRDLPVLADLYFDYLEQVCGRLRPSRSGTEFRAIGCLMSDFKLFQSIGLVPGSVVEMQHGQQFGYQFWMQDQTDDYYRRHLLLHEFAHVYMTCDTGLNDLPDGWFMEGAAEMFATHVTTADSTNFGILPTTFTGFEGWGRISAIARRRVDRVPVQFSLQPVPSIEQVQFPKGAPARDDMRYAWWWALSWMLGNHPHYADDWARLCHLRGRDEFRLQIGSMTDRHGQRLSTDWLLFAESLCESFDVQRSFALHLAADQPAGEEFSLEADRNWQDTGWELAANASVSIECSGRCVIDETTAPWVSEPNGVTLEYNQGRPLGEVLAVLVSSDADWISQRIAVGKGCTITAPQAGRLWLQINDSAGARSRNSGSYHVTIRQQSTLSGSNR